MSGCGAVVDGGCPSGHSSRVGFGFDEQNRPAGGAGEGGVDLVAAALAAFDQVTAVPAVVRQQRLRLRVAVVEDGPGERAQVGDVLA